MDKEFPKNHQFLLAEVVTKKILSFLIAFEIRTITISNLNMLFSLFFMCIYARISHSFLHAFTRVYMLTSTGK